MQFFKRSVAALVGLTAVVTLSWQVQAADEEVQPLPSAVTVLGLGAMGTAVVQCLASQYNSNGNTMAIHAWNRGEAKREAVRDVATVHDTAEAAVRASNLTLVLIDDWQGTMELIKELKEQQVFDAAAPPKTLVLFSTYTPMDIHLADSMLTRDRDTSTANAPVILVGGAIVGVPQTICTPSALILTSSGRDSDGEDGSPSNVVTTAGQVVTSTLQPLGRVVSFKGDTGSAALANMALILVITFGIAGQELAHLMIQQYYGGAAIASTDGDALSFVEVYTPLSADVGPAYTKMLLPLVSQMITSQDYTGHAAYVPVGVFRRVLLMQAEFMHNELGIHVPDTFLATYVDSLHQVPNEQSGPAAWIEHAAAQPLEHDESHAEEHEHDEYDEHEEHEHEGQEHEEQEHEQGHEVNDETETDTAEAEL